MNTITIDCGASFIKGAVFEEGTLIRQISRSAPSLEKDSDIFCARHITGICEMVRNMILELAGDEKEIILCISNEMHGFLLSDMDGRPYTDYISWQQDLREILGLFEKSLGTSEKPSGMSEKSLGTSEKPDRPVFEDRSFREHIRRTGMPSRPGLPNANLYWMHQTGNLPYSGKNLRFYTLGSYLLKVLSGGQEPQEHATNAAATGLFDLSDGSWNRVLLEGIGAGNVTMPTIGQEGIDFVFQGIKVHALPAVGDQQAALLGAGLSQYDELSFNLGTGAQVSRLTEELTFSDDCQIRPFFYGKYLKTIPHIPSGRALNVYVRFVKSILEQYGMTLNDDDVWAGLLQSAKDCSTGHGLKIDLDFFPNALNGEPSEGGKITGISEYGFSLGCLMKAVMEQMAENFTEVADRLEPEPASVKRLLFSGGVARRLESVRNRVAAHYPGAIVTVSSNETMLGLYRYSKTGFRNKQSARDIEQ